MKTTAKIDELLNEKMNVFEAFAKLNINDTKFDNAIANFYRSIEVAINAKKNTKDYRFAITNAEIYLNDAVKRVKILSI